LVRHEHASLALAQRSSGLPGNVPLFSALLNYRYSVAEPAAAAELADEGGIQVLSSQERTNYPCTLSVDDLGTDFALSMQVVQPLEAQRLCRYMHQALEQVVEALEQAPQTPSWRIDVLDEVERHQLLVEWNAAERPYPQDRWVHELFEAQVERTPDAPALVHEQQSLTYAQLNTQANRLAHHLRDLGVGPDVRVAICAQRGIEMVVGVLATLKAGGAYVPLGPAYPGERLTYMLQDSGAAVLLLHAELSPEVRSQLQQALGVEAPIVELHADAHRWSGQPEKNLDRKLNGVKPQHLAYVIYTSGSTGRPKGVAIEHRNTVNFICWAGEAFTGQQLQRTLFSTSLSFDLAVYECLVPLSVGSTVHLVGSALQASEAQAATLINTVPSAIAALLDQPGGVPGSVRTVNLAGEPLKRSLVEELFEQTPVREVCNLYGPSETTTYSTWVRMERERGFQGHIGRPVATTRVYILDAHGEPAPIGVAGEIYIGGAGVARGYLNRPELTAERFVPLRIGTLGLRIEEQAATRNASQAGEST